MSAAPSSVDRARLPLWVVAVVSACMLAACSGLAFATSADKKLPPQTLRGPIDRLRQYPALSLATSDQRAAARRLRAEIWKAMRAGHWQDTRAAAEAGYDPARLARAGNSAGLFLHVENLAFHRDALFLAPEAPETLIYANAPGRPLVLIGVMFAVSRGMHGPTPGGPITRWHTHRVCAQGAKRGLKPRPDGTCPPGTRSRQGAEMLHFWFTSDLRSAYAIHGPLPELCAEGKVHHEYCHRLGHAH